MLDITGEHIALLGEEDLRTLVGRLCEAEVRSRGFSPSTVTWGGHQKAKDGGLDVCVCLPDKAVIDGFIPRPSTGFQVKREDMPPNRLLKEMKPKGRLRQAIQDLREVSGAYIIVSSLGSVSYSSLQNRRLAMAKGIATLRPNGLLLDFYDRSRIATWVRSHPGLIPWVRAKIGKPISGWQSCGAWACSSEGFETTYLVDETTRFRVPGTSPDCAMNVIQGIDAIRGRLAAPGGVVRLVGLSGVGKTRFAQALFDPRVAGDCLDPALAIYTNLSDDPNPQPIAIASDLLARGQRGVLVIDNCPQELHRRLAELCQTPGALISLLTIEYDIQEDLPEGTDVYELHSSSSELIEKLVERRFPLLSKVNAHSIADLSGGNARIAIALAGIVEKNEDISGLRDQELFQRLFQQRQQPDQSLLLAAQACSLVYSFNGEDVSNTPDSELQTLGATVGIDAQSMFRHVVELRRRDLVQQRGVWRAVLPHALSNRLAALALQNIPPSVIQKFINSAPPRLLQSFSRRIGFLHSSEEARSIVRQWLAPDGLLDNVTQLNDVGVSMFTNIAPVCAEATLCALERAMCAEDAEKEERKKIRGYASLLRSLAYDARYFDRSVALLLAILENEDRDSHSHQSQESLTLLFSLYLSGTHAPVEQRMHVVESLLSSERPSRRQLGVLTLKSALEAWHFSAFHSFSFGAHSRDFGYWPRTRAEVQQWYRAVLQTCERLGCSTLPVASEIRAAVAEKFRGLWTKARMYQELDRICQLFRQNQFWPDGWIAARTTQQFDAKGFNSATVEKLSSLELMLRPATLLEQVRTVVLCSSARHYLDLDLEDGDGGDASSRYVRMEETATRLGVSVATDEAAFSELLPELLTGGARLWSFGRGLAEGCNAPKTIWHRLVQQLSQTERTRQNIQLLCGFMQRLGAISPELVDQILESAVSDEVLAPLYPALQSYSGTRNGVHRLIRSLDLGIAMPNAYSTVFHADGLSGSDVAKVAMRLATRADGFEVAADLIYMRLQSDKDVNDPDIVAAGRQLLSLLNFGDFTDHEDYRLGKIAEACLVDTASAPVAEDVCRKLRLALSEYRTHASNHDALLSAIFRVQPYAALDGLFGDNSDLKRHVLNDLNFFRQNPFDSLPENAVLAWCSGEPTVRYALMATAITPFRPSEESGPLHWTPLALRILENAPDRPAVLARYAQHFSPMSWSGSRAAIMELNFKLLDDLESHPDPAVAKWVHETRQRLEIAVDSERRQETASDKMRDERFE